MWHVDDKGIGGNDEFIPGKDGILINTFTEIKENFQIVPRKCLHTKNVFFETSQFQIDKNGKDCNVIIDIIM